MLSGLAVAESAVIRTKAYGEAANVLQEFLVEQLRHHQFAPSRIVTGEAARHDIGDPLKSIGQHCSPSAGIAKRLLS